MDDEQMAESDGWYSNEIATFGDRIAAAREALAMSVEELSGRLGVRESTLRAWENDLSEPRANKLQMLSGLLNVSLRWMMTGEGDGLGPPPDEGTVSADIADVIMEIRMIRGQMAQASDRLSVLEKRLKARAASLA